MRGLEQQAKFPLWRECIGTYPATVIGVDLAGSERRPTGWAALRGAVAQARTLRTDAEILDATLALRPRIVSIDSPLSPFMIFGCLSFTSADASLATRIIAGIRSFDAPGPIAGAVAFTGSSASRVHHAFITRFFCDLRLFLHSDIDRRRGEVWNRTDC